MRFKHYLYAVAMLATLGVSTTSCDDDDEDEIAVVPDGGDDDANGDSTEGANFTVSGDVSGVWEAGSVVGVTGHITVPEGQSLTIEEGVTVVFPTEGVGTNHVPVEFIVKGNLYCKGTADAPVLMTIPEAERTTANIHNADHEWGGIVAYESCEEMLIDHTIIEYTGGEVVQGSPAADAGYYEAGDDIYPQITTNNPNGRYVITNSIIRYGQSDGIYMMGGRAIIANNIFAGNGYDGEEAVNVKSGCIVDVARNIMYSPNTNGLKLSSGGQSETRYQAEVTAYNNTILNAGWRRDGEKGGCIYAEENVLANVFNNMMVNCKYRAQVPSWDDPNNTDGGFDTHSVIDYNCYVSARTKSDLIITEWEDDGEIIAGQGIEYAWQGYTYDHEDYHYGASTAEDGVTLIPAVDANSLIANGTEYYDPQFRNYDLDGASMKNVVYDESWDFTPTVNLQGAYNGNEAFAQPHFATSGLSVGGQTYTSPAVGAWFGCYAAN